MGIYTDLVLACELKEDISQKTINTIKWWLGDCERNLEPQIDTAPDIGDLVSYYGVLNSEDNVTLPGIAQSSLYNCLEEFLCVSIRISRKNYYSEIERFLYWLAPCAKPQGFV